MSAGNERPWQGIRGQKEGKAHAAPPFGPQALSAALHVPSLSLQLWGTASLQAPPGTPDPVFQGLSGPLHPSCFFLSLHSWGGDESLLLLE